MLYVCPTHPEVVLFTENPAVNRSKRKKDAAFGAVLTEVTVPRLCPQCNSYYLKHECNPVAEVSHEANR